MEESTPISEHPNNLANGLRQTLSQSRHDWQYCFLERGGGSGETYLSPKQLLKSSEDLAKKLVESTPANSGIILLFDHGPAFLITLLACIFAQRIAIPAPLPRFGLHSRRLGKIYKFCDNVFILTKHQHRASIKQALLEEGLQFDGQILTLEYLESDVKADFKGELPGFSTELDEPVIVQFTSGSTSDPKGVMISSGNILANHYEVATRWKFHCDKIVLSWLPYFHDMGLFGGLLYPLLSGQKIVQIDPIHFIQKPQRWLFAISKFRVNFSGGPAFAYDLCNQLNFEHFSKDIDLSSWEVAFCGADYVSSSTMRAFRSNYSICNLNPFAVTPVYGLAESTLFVAGQPNPECDYPIGYEGNFTEGCYLGESDRPNIEIRDLIGKNILPDGEIGEICVLGKSISRGYYKEDNPSSRQVLESGDLGFIRGEYMFICGRIKDIIVKYGQNISPSDIEQLAASASDFLNPHAAVAFQTDLPEGNIILLIETKKTAKGVLQNQHILRSAIAQVVQQRVGVSLAKIEFLKRGELMRTSSGKIQRRAVAKNYQLGHQFRVAGNANN
jgi:acyl-CoA synthetase (AMP-forming)/AMP-acid ligase II